MSGDWRRHDPIPGPEVIVVFLPEDLIPLLVRSRLPAGFFFGQGLPAPYLPAERAEDRPPARTALAGLGPGLPFGLANSSCGAIQGCSLIP